ncbi:hypothetical protein BLNAU_8095 [Blattamonas nauphoetae]|uniref:Uncharacterized protein n=1 Tax=Blattamonas nauphoetae TaxID=2049346 RepID=A0ABQ9XZU6_9EUKA|nr:hypothetical protein BLNAU_8095 [Blattamonas nauphoetae]
MQLINQEKTKTRQSFETRQTQQCLHDFFGRGARLLPRAVETACPSSASPVLIVCSVRSDDVKFAVLAECKSVPKLTTTDDIDNRRHRCPNKLRRARRAPRLLRRDP